MDGRTEAFKRLKPTCVSLGEAANVLAKTQDRGSASLVTRQLEELKRKLSLDTSKGHNLHPRLAEYVFVPIAQVLRVSQNIPVQCLELCVQCISILVEHGWQQQLPGPTAAQLLILCTLLAERRPQGLSFAESTDELQASSLWCLHHILKAAGQNVETRNLLTAEAHFPQLGKTITVILDGIEAAGSQIVDLAAISALKSLLHHVADRQIQLSFLPGIVSRLTRVLTPSTRNRRSKHLLTQCLDVVSALLRSVLGDSTVSQHAGTSDIMHTSLQSAQEWQANAATQLKPALASIVKLKSHRDSEVAIALGNLCLILLRDCRTTLENCSRLALETVVEICATHHGSAIDIGLEMLLRASSITTGLLQDLVYDQFRSLMNVVQGADDEMKVAKLHQIHTAYRLLTQIDADVTMIDRTAATALRDSVVINLQMSKTLQNPTHAVNTLQAYDMVALHGETTNMQFKLPFMMHHSQSKILDSIFDLTRLISNSSSSAVLSESSQRSLQQSQGETQAANYWMLLTAAETVVEARNNSIDAFVQFGNDTPPSGDDALEEIYSFALTTLAEQPEQSTDFLLKALALRAIALRARSEGKDFRFELVDALYPVLHTLATPHVELQRDSIVALNIITSACGYTSVKDLIVENVDYLTNSVALKLNAFDVSPQAPQVLLMMVRLAGPSLLPYLEDTIDSIFAALEDFHGYPLLVELLFKVLGVIANEGVKAPQFTHKIEDVSSDQSNKVDSLSWQAPTVEGLATLLRIRKRDEADTKSKEQTRPEAHPQRPWAETTNPDRGNDIDEDATEDNDMPLDQSVPERPQSKTYNTLLKITDLTQHFLPSASPSLRTSLLGLVRTTAPALSQHEDSFLPLINTLWPEIVSRLDDEEWHVVASSLDIISVLCECAGEFMRTRIVQLWPRVVEIHASIAKEFIHRQPRPDRKAISVGSGSTATMNRPSDTTQEVAYPSGNSEPLGNTSTMTMWSALENLILAVVGHVHLAPELFDEALEMMEHALKKSAVRLVFEKENSDAVWLVLDKRAKNNEKRGSS